MADIPRKPTVPKYMVQRLIEKISKDVDENVIPVSTGIYSYDKLNERLSAIPKPEIENYEDRIFYEVIEDKLNQKPNTENCKSCNEEYTKKNIYVMCNFCGNGFCTQCIALRKRPKPTDISGKRYNVCTKCDVKYLNLQLGHKYVENRTILEEAITKTSQELSSLMEELQMRKTAIAEKNKLRDRNKMRIAQLKKEKLQINKRISKSGEQQLDKEKTLNRQLKQKFVKVHQKHQLFLERKRNVQLKKMQIERQENEKEQQRAIEQERKLQQYEEIFRKKKQQQNRKQLEKQRQQKEQQIQQKILKDLQQASRKQQESLQAEAKRKEKELIQKQQQERKRKQEEQVVRKKIQEQKKFEAEQQIERLRKLQEEKQRKQYTQFNTQTQTYEDQKDEGQFQGISVGSGEVVIETPIKMLERQSKDFYDSQSSQMMNYFEKDVQQETPFSFQNDQLIQQSQRSVSRDRQSGQHIQAFTFYEENKCNKDPFQQKILQRNSQNRNTNQQYQVPPAEWSDDTKQRTDISNNKSAAESSLLKLHINESQQEPNRKQKVEQKLLDQTSQLDEEELENAKHNLIKAARDNRQKSIETAPWNEEDEGNGVEVKKCECSIY